MLLVFLLLYLARILSKRILPPIGAAKLLDTPRAQAQASISTFLASFT